MHPGDSASAHGADDPQGQPGRRQQPPTTPPHAGTDSSRGRAAALLDAALSRPFAQQTAALLYKNGARAHASVAA